MSDLKHILVGTDLTDRSDRAVERALRLSVDLGGSGITLLHVITPGLPAGFSGRQERDAQGLLADLLTNVPGQALTNRDYRAIVLVGDPFSVIVREAIARNADLIVVGEPGKYRTADMFAGTTAERVIRFTDRPVLLVRQPVRKSYSRVLVAFDGSEGASRALTTALALVPKGEFRLLHAWWPPRSCLTDGEEARSTVRAENARIRALIERAAKQATKSSNTDAIKLSIDMVEDNPYLVVRNESGWPDLLVMGTHSRGRLATTAGIGNLARHMLAEAPCDVLVSRP